MYYIHPTTPNHGNPMSQPFPNCITLPDALLSDYLATRGFCNITVEDGVVTALTVNQEALDAYLAEFPDVEPEKPVTMEDLQAENKRLTAKLSMQAEQQTMLENCLLEMADIVYA